MKFGLKENIIQKIQDVFAAFPQVHEAVLYGSRAKGNFKNGSDIDLTLKGENLNLSVVNKISLMIDDLLLPYTFDISVYKHIDNKDLLDHISRVGISFYKKQEWKETTLKEFAEIQTGPFGSQLHAHDYVSVGTPSIMPTNIGNRLNILTDKIAFVSDKDIERLKRYTVKETDIVYSRRGDVEKCAFINKEQEGWLCGTGCLRIRFTSSELFPKFCAYYLSTPEIKSWVLNHAVGTTMPNLNSSILGDVPLFLPPLPEQKAIAEVLNSLDDKIDLLHKNNATLETTAETLFRQWFVEEENDWEVGTIEDEFDFVMGQSPLGNTLNEENQGMIFYQGSSDFGFRFPTQRVFTTAPNRLAKPYDTLISVRAPVGAMNMAYEECCLGRGVAAFRYKHKKNFYSYTFYKLRSLMKPIMQFEDNGSVFGSIGKDDFKKIENSLPPKELIDKFQENAKPIDEKIYQNETQIKSLQQLRDLILPKFMSGEVRVKN